MATSRNTAGMFDMLRTMLGDVGQAMAAPDADQQFLSGMQQMIVAKLKQPMEQAQAVLQPTPNPLAGGPPGGPPGAAGPLPGAGGPPAGLRREPSLPPVEELARMMSNA